MPYSNIIPIDFNPFEEQKEIVKIVPTNEPQKEIWLSCIIGGNESNLGYNESISLDFEGDFHLDHFRNSLQDVMDRHEALRSSVSGNGESLFIYNSLPIDFIFEDISEKTDQEALLKAFVDQEMYRPFNLQEGPLLRTFVHKLNSKRHYFSLFVHHIICDGWSLGVILNDLSSIYNAKVRQETLSLPKAHQISDYAKEMYIFQQGEAYRLQTDYWLNMYSDKIPVLDLPTDRIRPSARTYKATRLDYKLPLELINKLKKAGAKSGCTLVNTLLSAFEVFLYLKTNQLDIVVGLPSAGQSATEKTDLVGHCVNLLPLRTTIDPKLTFSDYLKKRKSAFFDAYDNQKITFGELIKTLNVKRDSSRIPLVPVVFNIDMGMDNDVHFDQLEFKLISNPRAYETFEIFLNATGSKSSFILEWSYNTQLFNETTIYKLAADFEELLEKFANNPSELINELSTHVDPIWLAQIKRWNNTKYDYPADLPFTALIDQVALKHPSKTAVKFGKDIMSYENLVSCSNQFAHYLAEKGIKHGDIVGLAADRSIELLVALLGIIKAGAIYLPLDPEYPHDRIEYMLEDSGAKMLLVSKIYEKRFHSKALELSIEDIWFNLDSFVVDSPILVTNGNDLVYVLYTSGSTGKPKGVKITHRNLTNFLLGMQQSPGITIDDKLLAITTISFDIAGLELYLPLISGAELIICDRDTARDGRLLMEITQEENITMMQATPSTWRMIIDSGLQDNNKLKILCGGEALSNDLAEKLSKKCKELWNMYGPTETTIWSTIKEIKGNEDINIGRPIMNTQIYILDENERLVAPGIIGEICIGGEGVAAGYLNRPELTTERFIKDFIHSSPDHRIYKTGDLGKFLDNGEILCLGRIDQQIKIRGHRIELGEIENELLTQEGIKQAVVTADEDHSGNKTLLGYVTLREDQIKDLTPSWKDRWDNIYDIAAVSSKDQELADQKMDVNLLENMQNSDQLAQQAKEWLDVSVKRLKKLNAQDIFEIGSGAGQLLFELAPDASSYYATDYAETAILKLQQKLNSEAEKWNHVKAKAIPAHEFTDISANSFDLILIHSVAQYFPNTAYFLTVIKESIKRLKDGGCLFIGDMQGKNTLKMHHAMDYLSHARPEVLVSDFKDVVNNRVKIEDEFVADPGFFYLLPKLIPAITGIDVQLRQGQSINETTKYHYDVWIYINSSHQVAEIKNSLEWQADPSLETVSKQLRSFPLRSLQVKNIFNARTAKDYTLLKWLETAKNDVQIKSFLPVMNNAELGIYPDTFSEIGDKLGFETHIRWSTDGTDGFFDVVFIPGNEGSTLPPPAETLMEQKKPEDFARTPLLTNEVFIPKQRIEQWKTALKQALPDYMVPSEIIGLKEFPLTPNHKIDKNSLPKPQSKTKQNQGKEDLPHNKHEQIISDIWTAVLGLENIGIKDDFFELGGHSLLAVKVMASIEKETGKRLPLATLFENSTIEKLAKKIVSNKEEKWAALVPIKTSGSKPPIYLIHGAGLNILLFKFISGYLDKEQPVYGLQAAGLSKPSPLLYTLEKISALYVSEVIEMDPVGPYYLTGYSSGGIIAFEMARQLVSMGKEIKFLGIVDSYAGDMDSLKNRSSFLIRKIKRQFKKLPFIMKSFLVYPKETLSYQANYIKYKLNFLKSNDFDNVDEHLSDYEKEIYRSYNTAHLNYILSPADVKVTLFNVNKRLYYIDDPLYLGWSKFANKGVDVYHIPGDHITMLAAPNDKEFASILQEAIDKC